MKERLMGKLAGPRPLHLEPEEAAHLTEALREAVSVALEIELSKVQDSTCLVEDLGLDSIDLFDVLDQLGETYGIQLALDALPEEWLRGSSDATFLEFASGLIKYFASPPEVKSEPGQN